MNHTTKITMLAICTFSLTVLLTMYGCNINGGTTGNTLNSIYESDRDKDGVIDAVYYYTYDIAGNEIKVEIDSDNDGVVDEVRCYNMEIAKK
ncbi:MAG: hypothetical protein ABFR35_00645 [Thermodesulfobacteriota bacterium]